MQNIYEAQAANKRKTYFVLVGFVLFITLSVYFLSNGIGVYLGYEPGGVGMVGIALIISGILSFSSYYFSDKIVLGISGARPADRNKEFNFYTASENLAIAAGIPKPNLYVIDDSATNAFATGRDPQHAVVCVTTGLLSKLTRSELEGVIAHELSHVKNYDTRLMSVVSVLVGSVALLADWFFRISWRGRRKDSDSNQLEAVFLVAGLLFALLSPIVSQLIQLSISRRREFAADAGSVSLTRQPQGLISALLKISQDREPLEAANKATAHLYISNPFKKDNKSAVTLFSGLFNTHPPIEDRVEALKKML